MQYAISVDADWRTTSARVRGRSRLGEHEVRITGDGAGHWQINGVPAPELDGCLDVDLESSACTNTAPVHRLGLPIGAGADAPAVYVRALDLRVERLEQEYLRIADDGARQRFDYRSPGFDFACELVYDEAGLVLEYPGIATASAVTSRRSGRSPGSGRVRCHRMLDAKHELAEMSDHVWQRIRARVDGLSDAEYFWEPTPGCWSVRQRADGTWMADWPLPRPDPEPFTTIAWRMWHLIDMYGEDRAPKWLDVPAQGPPIGMDDPDAAPPATAADAVVLLERAHDRWDAHLGLVPNERLEERDRGSGRPGVRGPDPRRVRHAHARRVHPSRRRDRTAPRPLAVAAHNRCRAIPASNESFAATRWCSTSSTARRRPPISSTRPPLTAAGTS